LRRRTLKRWTIRRTITFPRDDVLDDLRGVALGVPLLPHLLRHHELVGRGQTFGTDDPARGPNPPLTGDGVLVSGDDVPRDASSPTVVRESFLFLEVYEEVVQVVRESFSFLEVDEERMLRRRTFSNPTHTLAPVCRSTASCAARNEPAAVWLRSKWWILNGILSRVCRDVSGVSWPPPVSSALVSSARC
jgi:hypothetical protein